MKLVGLPRYSLSSLASGSTVAATMPLTKLTNGESWDVARLTQVDPRLTYVEGVPTMPLNYYGPEPSVGGVAWVNHNLSLGATARTLLLDATAAAGTHVPERVAPNALDLVAGFSGAETDIDEDPYSTDASSVDTTLSGLSTVDIHFATPTLAPDAGSDRQLFRVALTYVGTPTSISFWLYDGGTLIKFFTYGIAGANPMPQSGQVVQLLWDADDLTTSDGSGVKLRIQVNKSGTDLFSVEAVDWLCDSGVSAGSILGDTGWTSVTMDQYDAAWGATVSGAIGAAPQQTFLHTFSDANVSSVAKIVTYFRDPLNTATYIDLGEFVAGPIFVPGNNADWGEVVSLRGRDKIINGEGGSRWGIRREPTRSVKINLSNLTASEAQSLLERFWRAGMLLPYVIQVLDDSTESRHTTLYVCTDSLPRMSANYVDYRSVSFDATEKL